MDAVYMLDVVWTDRATTAAERRFETGLRAKPHGQGCWAALVQKRSVQATSAAFRYCGWTPSTAIRLYLSIFLADFVCSLILRRFNPGHQLVQAFPAENDQTSFWRFSVNRNSLSRCNVNTSMILDRFLGRRKIFLGVSFFVRNFDVADHIQRRFRLGVNGVANSPSDHSSGHG